MSELGYLGLGSNVGDRRANLQAAVELASSPFLLADDDAVSVGHYLVERVRGRALAVRANELRLEPVRCPAGFDGSKVTMRTLRVGIASRLPVVTRSHASPTTLLPPALTRVVET